MAWLRGGIVSYLSVTWPILTDTPITIDTLFPSASSPGCRLASPSSVLVSPLLSHCPPQVPFSLHTCCFLHTQGLGPQFCLPQRGLPFYRGRSRAHRAGEERWRREETRGDRGCGEGHSSVSPAEGHVSDWTRQPTGHRLSLPSEPPAPLPTQVSACCCASAEPVGRFFRGLGWALGGTPEILDLSGPRRVTYWESHSPFGLH